MGFVTSIERGPPSADRRRHWEAVYGDKAPDQLSWFQDEPSVSLELIDGAGLPFDAALLDVGGGASRLVDALIARGYRDVTVLDVSATALATSRRRLGDLSQASWLREDLLTWEAARSYELWHDRAVFHFLISPDDQRRYLEVLSTALAPGGTVILGTFAADGPETCSGLSVTRHDPAALTQILGTSFRLKATQRELHRTPSGTVQPFTWILATHQPEPAT